MASSGWWSRKGASSTLSRQRKSCLGRLADAQQTTEERLGRLGEAQQSTERTVERLAAAQASTDEKLNRLIDTLQRNASNGRPPA